LKIVLVHDWLTGMRGGEKCLEVLCRRYPDAELFTLLHRRGRLSPDIERMHVTTSFLQRIPGITRSYRYFLPLMPRAIERLRVPADADVVVSFSHAVAKSIRVPRGVPHVCYCFTPMRYAWHLRADYFRPPALRGRTLADAVRAPAAWARDRLLDRIRRWDHETSRRVTHFVAISRTIAARITECYGRDAEVIYPPVDTDFYTPADVPREDFYLCVSALVPYKRLELAVAACGRLGRRLVIVGEGPERRRLERLAGPHVQFLGWQSDEDVRDLLRRTRALLFPGQEDFGIVPVEAQACGTPVVAYRQGGATETILEAAPARQGTGLFFDRQTPESLAESIERLEQSNEVFDPALMRSNAMRFNAARYESELLACVDRAASEFRTGSHHRLAA